MGVQKYRLCTFYENCGHLPNKVAYFDRKYATFYFARKLLISKGLQFSTIIKSLPWTVFS